MRSLDANPIVVKVTAALAGRSHYSLRELSELTHTEMFKLHPVLREMQRARIIVAWKPAHGTSNTYYKIPEHA